MESKRLKTVIKRPTVYHGVVTDYSKRENLDTPNRQDVVLTIDISKCSQQAYLDIPISTRTLSFNSGSSGDW